MARTLNERMKDWKWWGEQVAHIILGGATAAFTAIGNPVAACTAAAAWLASWREWEQRPVQSWGDTIFDWTCTVLGGVIIGIVLLIAGPGRAEPYTLKFKNPSPDTAYTQLRMPWGTVAAPCAAGATCSVVIDVPVGRRTITAEATAGGAWSGTSNALAVLIPPNPTQCIAMPACRFDADLDGSVSGTDFSAFVAAFGTTWIP